MKKVFQGKYGSIVTCILEIVVGVLLLINPVGFTSGIIIGAGVLMVLGGLVSIVRYFMSKPEIASQKQLLFKGVVMILGGAVCITKYDWFLSAFPLLTVIYAAAMLVLAAAKLQRMADMRRMGLMRWYMPGIAAALAAVLATIILLNPFGAANAVWVFVAVSLIAEAVVEIVTIAL
ncbi:MAG: DUF308 domain-containing protein [Clostridia bacterium]|nr:DUF308 domain-containing protein [Clostridia bacterium]